MKLTVATLISLGILFFLATFLSPPVMAASVSVAGKAKVVNTDNSYLDFTNYSSNVTVNDSTGVMSGYAFLEDVGWVAFGTTDNTQGPVSTNLTTGVVTGKAKVLLTDNFLDFTNYNSTVTVNVSTGVFSGYVFSEDVGWINFADTGVNTNSTTLDTVAPSSFALDSPGGGSYTNSERPSFRWRTTTDEIGSIANYSVEIDNGETGDFSITDIPAERTTEYVTAKYTAHYDGFSDGDANNNYISVYTHSSNEWASNNNDGKLKEGKRIWKVKAKDSNGNERVESRDLYADFSAPSVALTQVNSTVFSSGTVSTTDTTPTIFGKVSDGLAGDSIANKVVSGPKSVEVKLERKDAFGAYSLHSLATLNMNDLYWTVDDQKITDNTQQTSDKYAPFSFTPSDALSAGTYRVTVTGKDNAGNTGLGATFALQVNMTFSIPFFPAPEEKTEVIFAPQPTAPPEAASSPTPSETSQPISQEQGPNLFQRLAELIKQPFIWLGNTAHTVIAFVFDGINTAVNTTVAFVGNMCRVGSYTVNNLFAYIRGVTGAAVWAISDSFTAPRHIASKIQHWFAYSVGSFSEIVLSREPTRITDVKVIEVGADYAIVEWRTNHYTKNNKINWGENTSYGRYAFAEDYSKVHQVRLGELIPGTKYAFEVMSQNKNYIYDSFHEFVTKPQ